MSTKPNTRAYGVINTQTGEGVIVEASSQAAALKHAAGKLFKVTVLSPTDLLAAVRSGAEIQVAGAVEQAADQQDGDEQEQDVGEQQG